MKNIIIGEEVVNKANEIGTILSFENNIIKVNFKTRVAKLLDDAFEKGFLKYANSDLQNEINKKITKSKLEKEREQEIVHNAETKAHNDLLHIQTEASKTQFRVTVISASIRLDPAPITFRSVRKNDIDSVQKIFAECDKEINTLYGLFNPKMKYHRNYSVTNAKSKYCVGYLSKHMDTYVLRVFSRNDTYNNSMQNGLTINHSDTTEILRILRINGRDYCFTKNISFSSNYYSNTKAHKNWHVSDIKDTILLNEVILNCDCQYLNNYIPINNIDCLKYVNLLFPALYNNKAEIAFKHKAFSSAYQIKDIVSYLENFSSKQIDLASKHDAINVLPIIKKYGMVDSKIIEDFKKIITKRKNQSSIYDILKSHLSNLGFDYSDLDKRLIDFFRKLNNFYEGIYLDYINELVNGLDITIKDFFDKDYVSREYIMMQQKRTYVSEKEKQQYSQIANELSWIDREENGHFVIIPKTIDEFMHEGENQHNCVYTNKYFKKVIARRSIIVFLREEKTTPFITIEFEYETFEVLQALGKYNYPLDDDMYRYVIDLGKQLHYEMLSLQ